MANRPLVGTRLGNALAFIVTVGFGLVTGCVLSIRQRVEDRFRRWPNEAVPAPKRQGIARSVRSRVLLFTTGWLLLLLAKIMPGHAILPIAGFGMMMVAGVYTVIHAFSERGSN